MQKPKIHITIHKGCIEIGGDTSQVEIDFKDYDVGDMPIEELKEDEDGDLYIDRW